MWRMAYFRIISVVLLIFGGTALVVPDIWTRLLGMDSAPVGEAWGRAFGAMALGFGVLVWVAGGSSDARVRRATAGAVALTFFAASVVDAALTLNGTYPAALLGWTYAAGNLALSAVAGYILLGSRPPAGG